MSLPGAKAFDVGGQLAVEHLSVGNDDHRLKELLVEGPLRGRHSLFRGRLDKFEGEPRNGVGLARPGRVLNKILPTNSF